MEPRGRRNIFDSTSLTLAVLLHIAIFTAIWLAGRVDASPEETAIPIDLLVVVNENLDGNEDEPPPERPIEDPPPPPPEEPKPAVPDPPPPPEPVREAVVQEHVKTNIVKVVEQKPPEKTKEQIEAEKKKAHEKRLAAIRQSAVKVKDRPAPATPPPRNNGRTEARPPDWEKLLNAGYRPASVNMGTDASEDQRCKALIRKAFHDKWEIPAWSDQLREMHLTVQLGAGGSIAGYSLAQSSGDSAADASVLKAASQVRAVRGLSRAFIENNRTVTVRFKVTPQ